MVSKVLFVFCASALFIQSISAQCIGNNQSGANLATRFNAGRSWTGVRNNGFLGNGGLQGAAANGGGLTVSSSSPIAPTGVTVVSDNAIEGPVEIAGQLPVLSSVTLEGQLSSGGAAGTTYSCGNGEVGISADSLNEAGVGAGNSGVIGAEINGIGAGFNGNGAGINGIGAGISNAGFLSSGLNAGLAGARWNRPACGGLN